MFDYIFIRGSIGVGKTSVSRLLYDRLRLNYYNPFLLEFDRFRNENVGEQITDLNQQQNALLASTIHSKAGVTIFISSFFTLYLSST